MIKLLLATAVSLMALPTFAEIVTDPRGNEEQAVKSIPPEEPANTKGLVVLKNAKLPETLTDEEEKDLKNLLAVLQAERKDPKLKNLESTKSKNRFNVRLTDDTAFKPSLEKNAGKKDTSSEGSH